MQYQRRINAILNWLEIPIELIYGVIDDDSRYDISIMYNQYNDHEHDIVYNPAEDFPGDLLINIPQPDHTLTDQMIEESISGTHNQ